MTEYASWVNANTSLVEGQEETDPKLYKDFISEKTKWLLDQRDEASKNDLKEEEKNEQTSQTTGQEGQAETDERNNK